MKLSKKHIVVYDFHDLLEKLDERTGNAYKAHKYSTRYMTRSWTFEEFVYEKYSMFQSGGIYYFPVKDLASEDGLVGWEGFEWAKELAKELVRILEEDGFVFEDYAMPYIEI